MENAAQLVDSSPLVAEELSAADSLHESDKIFVIHSNIMSILPGGPMSEASVHRKAFTDLERAIQVAEFEATQVRSRHTDAPWKVESGRHQRLLAGQPAYWTYGEYRHEGRTEDYMIEVMCLEVTNEGPVQKEVVEDVRPNEGLHAVPAPTVPGVEEVT